MSELQTREQMLFNLERETYPRAIAQARADGYAEGVEACAKVAERLNGWGPVGGNKVADHIAKQIRALTAPSGKERG